LSLTAVFTFVEKKQGVFLNFGSTAVSFLLALCPAHMGVTLAFEERISEILSSK
jgi:hypothetical protein